MDKIVMVHATIEVSDQNLFIMSPGELEKNVREILVDELSNQVMKHMEELPLTYILEPSPETMSSRHTLRMNLISTEEAQRLKVIEIRYNTLMKALESQGMNVEFLKKE